MTPDLQREFDLLSESARQRVADVPESGSYRHVFSFWARPSFAPSSRCTLYSPLPFAKKKAPFASFTIWRSDLDLEKFRSPVDRLRYSKDLPPTIEDVVLWLTEGEIEDIEQRLNSISIPFYVPSVVVGCDGTGHEFRFGNLFLGASLRWWENHPSEWRPFIGAVTQIVSELYERTQRPNQIL